MIKNFLICFCFALVAAHGVELTWDGNVANSGLQDGGGAWNTSVTDRWFNDVTSLYQAWDNSVAAVAVFGVGSGAAGTVTLGEPIEASGLIFNTAGSGNYIITGSTLSLTGAASVGGAADATLSAVLAGVNGLHKSGAGILTLSGSASNTFTGETIINEGTLSMNKSGAAVAVGGDIRVNSGGKLLWSANGQVAATTNVVVDGGDVQVASRVITLASYTQLAGGISTGNTANMTITGTLQLAGGLVLTLNSGARWSAHAADFTGFSTAVNVVNFGPGNSSVVTRLEIGSGGLTLSGQRINLNRPATAGLLGNELAIHGNVTASGANLITTAAATALPASAIHQVDLGAATRTWNITADTTTLAIQVAGQGGLTKTGNGTLALTGVDANTYAGLTTVSGGVLSLGKTAGVNAVPGNVLVTGGQLSWAVANQIPDNASIEVTGGITFALGGRDETFANYTQSGGLGFSSGSSNSGIVTITGLARLTGGSALTVNSGGRMTVNEVDATGFSGTVINLGGNTAARVTSFTVGGGGITLSGQSISLGGGLDEGRLGSELVLTGPLTATGTNNINQGSGDFGVRQVNLGDQIRTFQINGGTTTSNAPLVGTGGVLKSGVGVLTLANVNTYTGKTTVSAGSLVLGTNGDLADSSWIQIDAGATLNTTAKVGGFVYEPSVGAPVISGTGSVAGSLVVGGAASLHPGVTSDPADLLTAGDGVGTLSISGDLGFTTSADHTVAVFQIFSAVSADALVIGGDLALSEASYLSVLFDPFYTPSWGDSWQLMNWEGLLTLNGFSTGLNGRTGKDSDANEGNLNLPDLSDFNLLWNIDPLTNGGALAITIVPEPSRVLLVLLSLGGIAGVRRRS